MKYAILFASIFALVSYPLYAYLNPSLDTIIERQNQLIREANNKKLESFRQELIECIESASGEILSQLDACKNRPKPILQEFVGNNAKATTGSVIPVAKRPENQSVSLECEWGKMEKIEGIEFHFTATDEETTLQAIKNAHVNKGSEHIGYHYVIKPNGEITNTRDESCVAAADKWSRNNYRFIQIAFV
jgi:hypothetical protein